MCVIEPQFLHAPYTVIVCEYRVPFCIWLPDQRICLARSERRFRPADYPSHPFVDDVAGRSIPLCTDGTKYVSLVRIPRCLRHILWNIGDLSSCGTDHRIGCFAPRCSNATCNTHSFLFELEPCIFNSKGIKRRKDCSKKDSMSDKYPRINIETFIQNLGAWEDPENVGKCGVEPFHSPVELSGP